MNLYGFEMVIGTIGMILIAVILDKTEIGRMFVDKMCELISG